MEWRWTDEPKLLVEWELPYSSPLVAYLTKPIPPDSKPRYRRLHRFDRGRRYKITVSLLQMVRALLAVDRLPKEFQTEQWLALV